MAVLHYLLMSALVANSCAAPKDTKIEGVSKVENFDIQKDIKLEDIAKVEKADVEKTEEVPVSLTTEINTNAESNEQSQRRKRFYNYYGFPPVSPPYYPGYPVRDEPYNSGFSSNEAFSQIYRRLQEIAAEARQPSFPPPPPLLPPQSQFPFLVPVIYIPQYGACGCNPEQPSIPNPPIPSPTQDQNDTNVDLSNRFPEMEDERQNWGFVLNDTEEDDGLGDEYSRPISFVPVRPNRTMSRPPPPVEHGSSQAGAQNQNRNENLIPSTTTNRPMQSPTSPASPPVHPPSQPIVPPSNCDGAVLSCCHQAQVTYDCFVAQGCPDPTAYGNPCDTQVILSVIDRFQRYYGQRTG